jgi:hypothetical protein
MRAMFANKEVATRHLPIARGPEPRGAKGEKTEYARDLHPESRRISETRLQVAVVAERKRDDVDPYADVPCTD